MSSSPPVWKVRPLEKSDLEVWTQLFRGYAEFYERSLTEGQIATVWRWIFEEDRTMALVVYDAASNALPVGFAHLRSWDRPLLASENGYLDDLFVEPAFRGSGAVDTMFSEITELAKSKGWSVVRWTTAVDNFRAQGVYNKVAQRTGWVTYDLTV